MFALALIMFSPLIFEKNEQLHFRNGQLMTPEQIVTTRAAAFLLTVVLGFGAYRTAKRDYCLWQKTQASKKQ
jgi:hypothetical protein